MRLPEVLRVTGLSRVTIWRLEREGGFPKKVYLTGRTIAWRESTVRQWLESRSNVRQL
jgi:prophage regulatory protein